MECPQCQDDVDSDADHCPNCGNYLGQKKGLTPLTSLNFKIDTIVVINLVFWTIVFTSLLIFYMEKVPIISGFLENNSYIVLIVSILSLIPLNMYLYRWKYNS